MNKVFVILLFSFTVSAMEQIELSDYSEQYKKEYVETFEKASLIKSGKGYGGRLPSNAFGQTAEGQLYAYKCVALYTQMNLLSKEICEARKDVFEDVEGYKKSKFKTYR